MDIKGKNAIVTGVSKGIGFATVKMLVEHGVKVIGWGRTKPDFEHELFNFVETDVSDLESVESSYEKTVELVGKDIQILVNNAGLGHQGKFEELDVKQWIEMFDTNVHGIFYITRLLIPRMKEIGEGHIINISSIAGTTGIETMAGYAATKHAVNGISHSLYKEVRQFGIKVTNIMPGSVQTNFFDSIDSVTANDNMMKPEDIAETITQVLSTSANYHHVDIEVRPLKPKG
ncbi:MAG: SDR family oxidoreductase [Bacteroidota bacterium]